MLIRLNVIDREGKTTDLDIKEGTTIRDAIEEKLSPDNYGVCEEIVSVALAMCMLPLVTLKN